MNQQGTVEGAPAVTGVAGWWARQDRGRRYFWASVFATIVLLATAWLWHVWLFYDFYEVQRAPVVKLKMSPTLVVLSELLRGITLAYIYPLCYRGGKYWSEGTRYGLLMGFFTGLVIAIIYAQVKFKSVAWLFAEFAFVLIQGAIVGLIIAYIYGEKAKD